MELCTLEWNGFIGGGSLKTCIFRTDRMMYLSKSGSVDPFMLLINVSYINNTMKISSFVVFIYENRGHLHRTYLYLHNFTGGA